MLSDVVRQELARQYQTLKNARVNAQVRESAPMSTVTNVVCCNTTEDVVDTAKVAAPASFVAPTLFGDNGVIVIANAPVIPDFDTVIEPLNVSHPFSALSNLSEDVEASSLVPDIARESPADSCVGVFRDESKFEHGSSRRSDEASVNSPRMIENECIASETAMLMSPQRPTAVEPVESEQEITALGHLLPESASRCNQVGRLPVVVSPRCDDCHDECVNDDFFISDYNNINTGCEVVVRDMSKSNCYSFKCNTFETTSSFRTSSVSLTRGGLREQQFSIRSSVKLIRDQHGRGVKNIVIRGPVYHITDPSISFKAGRLLVLTHASCVLFRIYVKLVSKCRLLMFGVSTDNVVAKTDGGDNTKELSGASTTNSFPVINYVGRHFDHLCADFKDRVIRNQSALDSLSECVKIAASNLVGNAQNTLNELVDELQISAVRLPRLNGELTVSGLNDRKKRVREEDSCDNEDGSEMTVSRVQGSEAVSVKDVTVFRRCRLSASVVGDGAIVDGTSLEHRFKRTFKNIFDLGDGESLADESSIDTDSTMKVLPDESLCFGDHTLTCGDEVTDGKLKGRVAEKVGKRKSRKLRLKKTGTEDVAAEATSKSEICFICCEVEADILFPCGKHSGCQRCVRQCWKADLSKQSAFGVKCPFCRGIGNVLINKDTLKQFTMPPYRLRTTANINYLEADESSESVECVAAESS